MELDWVLPLVTLTAMEIVLGIDNIVFLALLVGRLPTEQQKLARLIGLALALGGRLGLLLGVKWLMALTTPLFHLSSLPLVPSEWLRRAQHVDAITARDVILFSGGLFLIAKSTREIHKKVEGHDHHGELARKASSFGSVIAQIIVLDLVFSLDSVISAVGMVQEVWIMVVAMVAAVAFMLVFAGRISGFVDRHPTVKMLAMSFLVLIGVLLVAEGLGTHVSKGYIYFAMGFSLVVELLNMRARKKAEPATEADPRPAPAAPVHR